MTRWLPLTAVLLIASVLVSTGCSTPARRIEPGGPESVTTTGSVDIQDWNDAADSMIQSLLSSNELAPYSRENPAVLGISRIVNRTQDRGLPIRLLTDQVREGLSRSGKVRTTTTVGLGGNAEDPMAEDIQNMEDFYEDEPADPRDRMPDYTLSGFIEQVTATAGRTNQSTFVFKLALTDTSEGLAVWEDSRQITKQGTRGAVGW